MTTQQDYYEQPSFVEQPTPDAGSDFNNHLFACVAEEIGGHPEDDNGSDGISSTTSVNPELQSVSRTISEGWDAIRNSSINMATALGFNWNDSVNNGQLPVPSIENLLRNIRDFVPGLGDLTDRNDTDVDEVDEPVVCEDDCVDGTQPGVEPAVVMAVNSPTGEPLNFAPGPVEVAAAYVPPVTTQVEAGLESPSNPPTGGPSLGFSHSGSPTAGTVPVSRSINPGGITDATTTPRAVDYVHRPFAGDTTGLTPEQRAERATRRITDFMNGHPLAGEVAEDLAAFQQRLRDGQITPEQYARSLENLAAIADPQADYARNGTRSGISDQNRYLALADGIDNIAHPPDIDQGDRGWCNNMTVQEGLAHASPDLYTSGLRELVNHGTYTRTDPVTGREFTAVLPPGSINSVPRESQGSQNGGSNRMGYGSYLVGLGLLNHYHQQRGEYLTHTDAGGDRRFRLDANATGNARFTTQQTASDAGIDALGVAEMGRVAGLRGNFVNVSPDWLPAGYVPRPGDGINVIRSASDLARAREQSRTDNNGWSIAVVHSGDRLFTGTSGLGGSGGGHVVSFYANGNMSNQWGARHDQTGVSDTVMLQAMQRTHESRGGNPPARPEDQQRYDSWRNWHDSNPRAHEGIQPPERNGNGNGNENGNGNGADNESNRRNSPEHRAEVAALQAQKAALESQLHAGLDEARTSILRTHLSGIQARLDSLV